MPYDLSNVSHNQYLEDLTDILCSKTQNTDRAFFHAIIAQFFGKVASNMRVTVETKDRGSIPVNIYSLCLSPSGTGKGYSVNILENEILNLSFHFFQICNKRFSIKKNKFKIISNF